MPSKREMVGSLIGLLLGAAAVIGGAKTDAINLCSKVTAGVAIGETIKPLLTSDGGTVDAGVPADSGVPALMLDSGK